MNTEPINDPAADEPTAIAHPATRELGEGRQDERVVTDPDQYLGADLFSLDVLAQLLRDEHNLPTAYVEQTGGGCATVYAGDVVRDDEGDERWACASGPGSYGWGAGPSTASLFDFCIGPDSNDGEPGYIDANSAGCRTLRDIAALAAAQARTNWGCLTDASTLDALGLDSSLRSGLPEVTAQQDHTRGYCEAANAALHAAYAEEANAAEAARASRAAGNNYLAHHPAPTAEHGTVVSNEPESVECVCGNCARPSPQHHPQARSPRRVAAGRG